MTGITVGVDGSTDSLHAFSWAASLAAGTGGPLLAVRALQPVDSELWPDRWAQQKARARDQLEAWCRPLAEAHGVEIEFDAPEGDPRERLLAAAADHHSELLVVGSGSLTGPRASWLRIGSVAEYLARHSEVSLAVVAPEAPTEIRRVVAGYDGSEAATRAARLAADLAERFDAAFTAVAVVNDGDVEPGQSSDPQVRAAWTDAGLSGELVLVPQSDNSAAVLLETAAARSADVVVVGMRGLGGFLGLRIGTTALDVLHGARDVTVLLVHGT
jgi:nucleotide-binding universal stress UspA family protein